MICSVETGGGRASATWNRDGTILFGLDTGRPLSQVAAEGGTAVAATTLDTSREDAGHFRPHFLPDGRQFLFLVQSRKTANTGIYVGSLDSKNVKPILLGSPTSAYYVPSGQILFMRNSTLFAQDFDLERLEVQGEAIRIAESIFFVGGNAAFSAFSVSETGVLAYRTGNIDEGRQSQLAWFDRQGTRLETVGGVGRNRNPRLSPDGTRVAVQIDGESGQAIWVLGPGLTSSRLAAPAVFPVMAPGRQGTLLYFRQPEKAHEREYLRWSGATTWRPTAVV